MKQKNKPGEEIKKLLGKNVRQYRETIGFTQEKIAEIAGISLTYYGSVERGEKWPSSETLAGIALGLKVNPYDLLKPENIVSSEATKLTKKMLHDIQATVNQTIRAINVTLKENAN